MVFTIFFVSLPAVTLLFDLLAWGLGRGAVAPQQLEEFGGIGPGKKFES